MDPLVAATLATSIPEYVLSRAGRSNARAGFGGSEQGVGARKRRLVWLIAATFIIAAGGALSLLGWLVIRWPSSVVFACAGASVLVAATVALAGFMTYRSALAVYASQATLDAAEKRAAEQEKLAQDTTLPALLAYNRDQMALYHRIATSQARVAGRNSQTAMTIGFVALVAGSSVAIISPNFTTKLVTGSLAALGGIFSGYIAKTFLIAQDKAISQLYRYWEQPLATSYILTAERVAATFKVDSAKEKELIKLIDRLLLIATRRDGSPVDDVMAPPGRTRRSAKAHKGGANGSSAPLDGAVSS